MLLKQKNISKHIFKYLSQYEKRQLQTLQKNSDIIENFYEIIYNNFNENKHQKFILWLNRHFKKLTHIKILDIFIYDINHQIQELLNLLIQMSWNHLESLSFVILNEINIESIENNIIILFEKTLRKNIKLRINKLLTKYIQNKINISHLYLSHSFYENLDYNNIINSKLEYLIINDVEFSEELKMLFEILLKKNIKLKRLKIEYYNLTQIDEKLIEFSKSPLRFNIKYLHIENRYDQEELNIINLNPFFLHNFLKYLYINEVSTNDFKNIPNCLEKLYISTKTDASNISIFLTNYKNKNLKELICPLNFSRIIHLKQNFPNLKCISNWDLFSPSPNINFFNSLSDKITDIDISYIDNIEPIKYIHFLKNIIRLNLYINFTLNEFIILLNYLDLSELIELKINIVHWKMNFFATFLEKMKKIKKINIQCLLDNTFTIDQSMKDFEEFLFIIQNKNIKLSYLESFEIHMMPNHEQTPYPINSKKIIKKQFPNIKKFCYGYSLLIGLHTHKLDIWNNFIKYD
jgi:hypothetical protein